jgi:hypothetical protein
VALERIDFLNHKGKKMSDSQIGFMLIVVFAIFGVFAPYIMTVLF